MGCGTSAAAQADRAATGNLTPSGTGASSEADAAAALLGGSLGLSSRLELFISAVGLANLDTLSASDPMAIVLQLVNGRWQECGRTEVIANTNSPTFVKAVRFDYKFEEVQKIKIQLYDIDSTMRSQSDRVPLASQDFLGEIECQIAQIMGSRGSTLRLPVKNAQNPARAKGHITVKGEEMKNANAKVTLQLRAQNLDNKDTFGKSDPFLRISRVSESGAPAPVFKTEVVMNNLSPTWKEFHVTMQRLCNGDPYRPLAFEVFDWDSDGSHDLIGGCQTSFDDIMRRSQSGEGLPLINPQKRQKKGASYTNSGIIHVAKAVVTPQPSFLDFISGGCELSFMVAIDFTGSNGNPSTPGSLHYRSPHGAPNQYQEAILGIGNVLEFYDADKRFPVWGFGGAPYHGAPVSHAFQLTDASGSTECAGIGGVMEAYNRAMSTVQLAGPTLFTQVIQQASAVAASSNVTQAHQQYFVLLIITDGIINDMDSTIASIVGASALPLSILIVGVGSADFSMMEQLDGDQQRLSYNGRMASRDIVQFVAMKDHPGRDISRELLAEIPGQVLEFMSLNRILPNPPPAAPPMVAGGPATRPPGTAPTHGAGAGAGAGGAPGSASVVPPPSAPVDLADVHLSDSSGRPAASAPAPPPYTGHHV